MTRQIPLPLPHHTALGADDFLITDSNRAAAGWVNRWPDWPDFGVIVSGPAGSGKTHLVNLWRGKSGAELLTLDDIKQGKISQREDHVPAYAIDDADAVAGNALSEENFFHLFNHCKVKKIWLLMTMKLGAGQAGFVLPDLRSRLLTLPAVVLANPDDDLLIALIVKQFRDRQIILDSGVVDYLAARMPRDAAGVGAGIEKLDQASLAEGRRITVPLARKILGAEDA